MTTPFWPPHSARSDRDAAAGIVVAFALGCAFWVALAWLVVGWMRA